MHKQIALGLITATLASTAAYADSASQRHAQDVIEHGHATFARRLGDVVVSTRTALDQLGYVVDAIDPSLRSIRAHHVAEAGIGAFSGATIERSVEVLLDEHGGRASTYLNVVPHVNVNGTVADDDPALRASEIRMMQEVVDAIAQVLGTLPSDAPAFVESGVFVEPYPVYAWSPFVLHDAVYVTPKPSCDVKHHPSTTTTSPPSPSKSVVSLPRPRPPHKP